MTGLTKDLLSLAAKNFSGGDGEEDFEEDKDDADVYGNVDEDDDAVDIDGDMDFSGLEEDGFE